LPATLGIRRSYDKIDAVGADTENSDPPTFTVYTGKHFTSFQEYTKEDIRKLLLQSPLPTNVLLLPYICAMCNASLREGSLPATQKMAIITPVVKKPGLDPEEPQNYRPISNLMLISKVIERIVANQLKAHLADNDLMPSVQSAYRRPQ